MGRFPKVATRLSVAGAVALVAGSMMLVGVAIQVITSPAFADTSPFELFCTNTPIGNLVFNDVVMTGTLSELRGGLRGFGGYVQLAQRVYGDAVSGSVFARFGRRKKSRAIGRFDGGSALLAGVRIVLGGVGRRYSGA